MTATCISCGAAYGTGHYSWCEFKITLVSWLPLLRVKEETE